MQLKIETHVTDIVLFDIVGYSLLSDEDQFIAISLINQKLKEFLDILHGQSFLKTEEVVLGFAPTGDGAYIVLSHGLAGYGMFLAIYLRASLLQLKNQTKNLFSGLRTAIHFGNASPIKDITGNINFVGSGLNDCARLLCINKDLIKKQDFLEDDNFIIISSPALHQFKEKYYGNAIDNCLNTIRFRLGNEVTFFDKHKIQHKAHFIESSRHVAITPPKPADVKKRMDEIVKNYE